MKDSNVPIPPPEGGRLGGGEKNRNPSPIPSPKGRGILQFTFLFLLFSSFLSANSDTLANFQKRVKKITLDNGLRVLMVERPDSPVISFAMFIRTGGIDDPYGQSGMAHMFEHMLFKGTQTIGTKNYAAEKKVLWEIDRTAERIQTVKDTDPNNKEKLESLSRRLAELQKEHEKLIVSEEFWKIYEQAGGQGLNASTGYDFTNYVISLPKNKLKLWTAMESDRIKNPVLREFYKERDVVLEERRMRIDNSPNGRLWEAFLTTGFSAHHYGRPLIGWESEISRLTVDGAESFFGDHYDISRLVAVVVGGFDPKEAEKMIRSRFGPIRSSRPDATSWITPEPPQKGGKRVEVVFNAEPSLLIGYHRPDFTHPDNAALEVLSDILGTGSTSRFQKFLVRDKRIAASAWAGASSPGDRDPGLFVVGGTPLAPRTTADLEKAIYDELEKIKKKGPDEKELQKVKNFATDYLIRKLASNSGLAYHLGYYEAVAGDWRFLFELIEDIQAVTADDVKRVANEYLRPENRVVATLVKEK